MGTMSIASRALLIGTKVLLGSEHDVKFCQRSSFQTREPKIKVFPEGLVLRNFFALKLYISSPFFQVDPFHVVNSLLSHSSYEFRSISKQYALKSVTMALKLQFIILHELFEILQRNENVIEIYKKKLCINKTVSETQYITVDNKVK